MKVAVLLLAVFCGALAAPIEEDDALEEFVLGNRQFTSAVYKALVTEDTGNIVVSPFSAESILTLAYEGAKGETAEELVAGLFLPNTEEKIENAYKSFLPKLKGSEEDDLVFASANKIYVQDGIELQETFSSLAKSVFESEVASVDFGASQNAAAEINEWVESQTNNKIKNLVDPDSIGEHTNLLLVNTLYLSGKWLKSFTEFPVTKGSFAGSDVEVDYLHQEDYLNYYEDDVLDAKFLELPLVGANVSVVIVLPNEEDGLSSLEENIEKVLEPQPFTQEGVMVYLPKFSVETEVEFVPILKSLGVEKIFSVDADLSGIASTEEQFFVSNVVQKVFINVTEAGVEAAAATDVVGPTDVPTISAHFHADHPFLYYIKDEGVVLFAGRFVQP